MGNETPCRSAKLNKYNHRAPYYVVSLSAFLSNLNMPISGEGSAQGHNESRPRASLMCVPTTEGGAWGLLCCGDKV
jgi:hypothetical protein